MIIADYWIYIILGIQSTFIIYLLIKIRQPVIIRRPKKMEEPLPELDDIGDMLKEIQPEIERNLKLNEDQKKALNTWISTIDKFTKSKVSKWILKKIGGIKW